MTMDIEERVRSLEKHQAISETILARMEQDLANIAASSNAIQEVVTRWKGGMGALVLVGGLFSAAIAVLVDVVGRRLFP